MLSCRDESGSRSKGPDWRAIAALIWAFWFGTLYVDRMIRAKAPRVSSAIEQVWSGGLSSLGWRR